VRRISLDLDDHTFERLRERATAERRDPRDQAAVLVERALLRRVAPPHTPTSTTPRPRTPAA
jgi:predicted Zn-dependent peptidase